MNLFICTGRLAADPECKGNIVVITVPTTDRWKDKTTGAYNENTEWHKFIVFGKTGEYVAAHLKKGQMVEVTASLHYTKWVEKETGAKRTGSELRVQTIKSLGPVPHVSEAEAAESSPAAPLDGDDFADLG